MVFVDAIDSFRKDKFACSWAEKVRQKTGLVRRFSQDDISHLVVLIWRFLQLTRIPKEKRLERDQEVMHSFQDLEKDKDVPYKHH